MSDSFLTGKFRSGVLSTAAFLCLFALSASAQNAAPAAKIGPPPANTKQGKIIDGALSAQTRQTLQEAMNSVSPAPAK